MIHEEDLLGLTRQSGQVLLDGLMELQRRYPGVMDAARGRGTLIAADCPTTEMRLGNQSFEKATISSFRIAI